MRISVTSYEKAKLQVDPYYGGSTQGVEAPDFEPELNIEFRVNEIKKAGLHFEICGPGRSGDNFTSRGYVSLSNVELQKLLLYSLEHGLITLPGVEELTTAYQALLACMAKQNVQVTSSEMESS